MWVLEGFPISSYLIKYDQNTTTLRQHLYNKSVPKAYCGANLRGVRKGVRGQLIYGYMYGLRTDQGSMRVESRIYVIISSTDVLCVNMMLLVDLIERTPS